MIGTSEDTAPGEGPRAAGVQEYYARNAALLGERYGSVTFEDVHGEVEDLLPPPPARVLDVGAGTGRDAAALARRGYRVLAAEPVAELRAEARRLHPDPAIEWAASALPDLRGIPRPEGGFDLVLLSAVWMHLPPEERAPAMTRLAALLAPTGLLVISLRRGTPPEGRVMYDVPAEETAAHAARAGLRVERLFSDGDDHLGRADVWWQSLSLRHAKGAEGT
ncbi:class I SAM-dependent methyltransferase [Streptomyces sp. NPDC001941]|uniref:class I SAM-dependent methyltransferase n=1 Tax=Streptomyces sp. NPDC001941 TaxID=3154659 RepID=UPI0033167D36